MPRRFFDLTLPLRDGVSVWPGDPRVSFERCLSVEAHGVSVTNLALGTHSGTHVDAPAHIFEGGATVDGLALETLTGPATVAHVPARRHISAQDLIDLGLPPECRRLLVRTRNTERRLLVSRRFAPDYVAFLPDAAAWMVERGITLVGIDALSVDPFESAAGPVHRELLGAGVVIVEGLKLAGVPGGEYHMCCLPMLIAGGDGAPARVVLYQDRSPSG